MRCVRVIIALAALSLCQCTAPESGSATAERATAVDASQDSGQAAVDRMRPAEAPQNAGKTTGEHSKAARALTPQAAKEAAAKQAAAKQAAKKAAVTEAQQVAAGAAEAAEAKIASLRALLEKIEADSRNETVLRAAAEDIVSKALGDHRDEREKAEQLFKHRLHALNATLLAKANASDVKAAFSAAKKAEKELGEADKATAHAMAKGYKVAAHAKMAAVRTLLKEAKEAAKHAEQSGWRVAKTQHTAGVPEHVYERTQGHSEQFGEELEQLAEHVGEAAEGAVENGADHLEDLVEGRADRYRDAAADEATARKRELRLAEQAVMQSRKEAFNMCDYLTTPSCEVQAASPEHAELGAACLDRFEKLKAHKQMVAEIPRVAAWLAKRPRTPHDNVVTLADADFA